MGDVDPGGFADLAWLLAKIGLIAGVAGWLAKALGIIKVSGGFVYITSIGLTVWGAGATAGLAAVAAVVVVVMGFAKDRCSGQKGSTVCVAGAVEQTIPGFSDWTDYLAPFKAAHDRVDLVVKSDYWDVVEYGGVSTFCNDLPLGTHERSEIMRCYFYDNSVCKAAQGALVGAAVGGVGGIIAGALLAAAIGCATVVLCLVALLVAALVAAAIALAGAAAGGNIAYAVADESAPSTTTGAVIGIGDLITVKGNMVRRADDNGANVLWWAESAELHGRASASLFQPFSYCSINDELAMDACPVVIL